MPTPRKGYFTNDGTKVPSVTTILGRWKESGGLLQWAFKQGQSGAATLYEQRDAAADIGTIAHAMCDAHIRGADVEAALISFQPTDEQRAKATTGYEAFCGWVAGANGTLISGEEPMVSEVHRFGGTPDFLIRSKDGKLSMADLKTSNGVYRDYAIQVAAYGLLWDENHPDDQINGGFHLLRVGKESADFEHRYWPELEEAKRLFLMLREAYDMDLRLKKRVG